MTIVILAGGEGRRFGGSKPQRLLGGETLLARALRIAQGWSDDVRVAVREDAGIDAPVILDDPEIEGPLGGVAAALRLGHETVLTIACDMPFLPEDLPRRLEEEIGDALAAVAASAARLHPVCVLWRKEALGGLDAYVATGNRSLHGFIHAVGYVAVEWPEEVFFNVNSADDLARAEALLKSR